jgi:hypothetical protein
MTHPADPAPTTMKSNSVKIFRYRTLSFHGHWSGGKVRFEDISKPQKGDELMRFSVCVDFQGRLPKLQHLSEFVAG